jgi:hypothetical protein
MLFGKTKLWNSINQNASRKMQSLENHNFMSKLCKVSCNCQTSWSSAYHGNFFPVGGAFSGIVKPRALSQSAKNLSKPANANWVATFPMTHCFWHCSSWGQTRPHIAGNCSFL